MNTPKPFQFDDEEGGFEHAMPLMDVILLILFFFLTTSTYSSDTGKMDLNLPTSARSNAATTEVKRVILRSGGRIFFGEEPVTTQQLNQRFESLAKEKLLLISAESTVDHEDVVEVMEQARATGVTEIGIEVEREPQDNVP